MIPVYSSVSVTNKFKHKILKMCKHVGVRLFTFTNLKNKVVLAIRVTLVIRRLQLKEEEINKEKRRLRNGEASAEGSKQGQIAAPFLWRLHVLLMFAWLLSRYSASVSGVRLSDDAKLPIGVNVSANSCLSVCVSPADL